MVLAVRRLTARIVDGVERNLYITVNGITSADSGRAVVQLR